MKPHSRSCDLCPSLTRCVWNTICASPCKLSLHFSKAKLCVTLGASGAVHASWLAQADHACWGLLQTMAMIESIWPSEQLAMALTNPVDARDVDPADPQVSYLQATMCSLARPSVNHSVAFAAAPGMSMMTCLPS